MPDLADGSVPVAVAAKVYGKDAPWIRAGIIAGWLPIGFATRNGERVTDVSQINSRYGRINYYISPSKLYQETGVHLEWQEMITSFLRIDIENLSTFAYSTQRGKKSARGCPGCK